MHRQWRQRQKRNEPQKTFANTFSIFTGTQESAWVRVCKQKMIPLLQSPQILEIIICPWVWGGQKFISQYFKEIHDNNISDNVLKKILNSQAAAYFNGNKIKHSFHLFPVICFHR